MTCPPALSCSRRRAPTAFAELRHPWSWPAIAGGGGVEQQRVVLVGEVVEGKKPEAMPVRGVDRTAGAEIICLVGDLEAETFPVGGHRKHHRDGLVSPLELDKIPVADRVAGAVVGAVPPLAVCSVPRPQVDGVAMRWEQLADGLLEEGGGRYNRRVESPWRIGWRAGNEHKCYR